MVVTLLILQAVAGPMIAAPRLRAEGRCAAAVAGEVTVCARGENPDRLKPLPERYDEAALPKAEVALTGKMRIAAEVEQEGVGGVPSNRAMVRLKLPF